MSTLSPFNCTREIPLLLCSDGLSGLVADTQIAFLLQADPLDVAAQKLVDKALAAGGNDNITAAVLRVIAAPPPSPRCDGAELFNPPLHELVSAAAALSVLDGSPPRVFSMHNILYAIIVAFHHNYGKKTQYIDANKIILEHVGDLRGNMSNIGC